MTDRELLELAARAAGIAVTWVEEHKCLWIDLGQGLPIDVYNPLDNDGDALRLAVKLEITPSKHEDTVVASRSASWRNGAAHCSLWEPAGDDPFSATRRAIVRAAAEIGKGMP